MKKQSTKHFFACLLISIAGFMSSCMKDYEFNKLAGIAWDPTLAAPLVHTRLTMNDILALDFTQGTLQVDATKFVSLVYKGELLSLSGSEIIQFPDQNFQTSQGLTAPQVTQLIGGSVTINFSQNLSFNSPNDSRVDSLFLKAGNLNLNLISDFQHSGNLTISIPAATKNGTSFNQSLPISYVNSVPVLSSTSVDLTGYKFNMTASTPNYNAFLINFTLTLNSSSAPVTGSETVTIGMQMLSLEFQKMFGYIGTALLSPEPDTVSINIFNNSIGGGRFSIYNPTLKIDISNSIGVPVQLYFTKLIGYHPLTIPTEYPFLGTGIPLSSNPLVIGSPTIAQIGQTIATPTMILDTGTSNIRSIIDKSPPYVVYSLLSQSNPFGTTNNFILDTSRFKVDVEIDLPLEGTAYGFVVQDTVDNYTLESSEMVQDFTLRTYVKNGFPCEVKIQVYFADENYNVIDSLMTSTDPSTRIILPAANVNSEGRAINAIEKTTDVTMSIERVAQLNRMKYLIVRGEGSSTNSGGTRVKIYSDYSIDLRMGAKANMKVKI